MVRASCNYIHNSYECLPVNDDAEYYASTCISSNSSNVLSLFCSRVPRAPTPDNKSESFEGTSQLNELGLRLATNTNASLCSGEPNLDQSPPASSRTVEESVVRDSFVGHNMPQMAPDGRALCTEYLAGECFVTCSLVQHDGRNAPMFAFSVRHSPICFVETELTLSAVFRTLL